MSIQFTDREIEIAIRWCEVNASKLFSHLYENNLLHPETTYEFNSRISITIHTMKKQDIDTDLRIRIIVFLSPYEHDKFFSLIINRSYEISSLRNLFLETLTGDILLCKCGRLGKFRSYHPESYECDNCYIYGFIRGEECSICKEDDGKPWIKTSCGHHFHDACWYKINQVEQGVRKCPLCRSEQCKYSITKL